MGTRQEIIMAELTQPIEQSTTEQIKSEKPKEEEMITVSKGLLDSLMKRIQGLERGEVAILDEVEQKRKATMRVWDKKLVIGWGKIYDANRENPEKGEKQMFELHLKNKDTIEKVEVEYLYFLREAERVEVEILRMNREDEITYHGFTTIREVEGYATRNTGIKVPVKVVIPKYVAIVKLPSGHELSVDTNYLNA